MPIEVSPKTEPDKDRLAGYAAIKYSNALCSKIEKRYWELEHVKNNPLIIAIADFHQPRSMLWTHPFIMDYLYGIRCRKKEIDGRVEAHYESIKEHTFGDKKKPSNFFSQPETENISAVLFSNSGTISKFNRMGRLAGFGDAKVKIIRTGICYNHAENSLDPAQFAIEVEEGKCTETWSEGVSIFHNPNAKFPLDPELFPLVGHHRLQEGRLASCLPAFFPIASITQVFTFSDGAGASPISSPGQ